MGARVPQPRLSFTQFAGPIFALLMAMVLGGCATSPRPLQRFEFAQPHMGTMFGIVLYAPNAQTATNAATAAFARVEELNRIMTDYDPDSELMQLCARPAGVPVKVSPDLFDVMQRGMKVSEMTDGAFDITIGEFVQLWRRARRQHELPTTERLDRVRGTIGWRKVKMDAKAGTVTLEKQGMHLDLGGIAKGYAADAALEVLRQRGVHRALVAASGDIAIGDPPPGEQGWKVGVSSIDTRGRELTTSLLLANRAISTSGDTEQFVDIDGRRYSHIVDPRTGLGLTHRLGVTVIARHATTTDSMATAVSVLGVEKGLLFVERHADLATLIVNEEDGRKVQYQSSRFPKR